jgi:hypothetical protein
LGLILENNNSNNNRNMPQSGSSSNPVLGGSITTPPRLSTYSVSAREAYTPDRGTRAPMFRRAEAGESGGVATTPLPLARSGGGLGFFSGGGTAFSDGTQHSPGPSPAYLDETRPMVTPAPQRQELRLAPPSVAQVPSTYMPESSPGGFWKFCDMTSTPARPSNPDMSPLKTGGSVRPGFSSPPQPPKAAAAAAAAQMESPTKMAPGILRTGDFGLRPPILNDDLSDEEGPLKIDLTR